jgi:hypothetical protein
LRCTNSKKRRCKWCGHWFRPKTYKSWLCSRRCTGQYWNAERRKQLKKRRCRECGHWFQPRQENARFCSARCCNQSLLNRKRRQTKHRCVAYKGGACERCGYNKCLAALDFHHPRRNKKDFRMFGALSWSVTLRRELDKCQLLCANCHREAHDRPGYHPASYRR